MCCLATLSAYRTLRLPLNVLEALRVEFVRFKRIGRAGAVELLVDSLCNGGVELKSAHVDNDGDRSAVEICCSIWPMSVYAVVPVNNSKSYVNKINFCKRFSNLISIRTIFVYLK